MCPGSRGRYKSPDFSRLLSLPPRLIMKKQIVFVSPSPPVFTGAHRRLAWLALVAVSAAAMVACGDENTSDSPGTSAAGSAGSSAGAAGSGGAGASSAGSAGSSAGGSSAGGAAGKSGAGGSAGKTAGGSGGSSAGAGGSAGGSITCSECVQKAEKAACLNEVAQCKAIPACSAAFGCLKDCGGGPMCEGNCMVDQMDGFVEYESLKFCLKDACASPCGYGSGANGCATGSDCSACDDAASCSDCCMAASPGADAELFNLGVQECGCAAGAACAAECAGNACAKQDPSVDCESCVAGQFYQKKACADAAYQKCNASNACKEYVQCNQACPPPVPFSCSNEPDRDSCAQCCRSDKSVSYEALATAIIKECGCVEAAACQAQCMANACMSQEPTLECLGCVDNQLGQGAACAVTAIKNCQNDLSCRDYLDCMEKCPL